jgi:hypothetical protein
LFEINLQSIKFMGSAFELSWLGLMWAICRRRSTTSGKWGFRDKRRCLLLSMEAKRCLFASFSDGLGACPRVVAGSSGLPCIFFPLEILDLTFFWNRNHIQVSERSRFHIFSDV